MSGAVATLNRRLGADVAREPSMAERLKTIWPISIPLLGAPLWWLTGASLFIWPAIGFAVVLSLMLGGRIEIPRGFGIWLLFLAWVAGSAILLRSGELLKFGGVAMLYLSVTAIFLFTYRAAADISLRRAIVFTLAGFWAIIVAGGYLGVLFPNFNYLTPASNLLPDALQQNPFIARRVDASAALTTFSGHRPRAPFGETNEWGANFALTLPFALAAIGMLRAGLARRALILLLPLSLVPVVLSLNRGLWLTLILVFGYALLTNPRQGGRSTRAWVIWGAIGAVMIILASPLGTVFSDRISGPGGSDETRTELYTGAVDLSVESPFLGYGTTVESITNPSQPPIGTHGHIWRVLVSHGLPAVLLFIGWFGLVAWKTRSGSSLARWCHLVMVMILIEMWFYNLLPAQLHLAMIAAAVGLRALQSTEAEADQEATADPEEPRGPAPLSIGAASPSAS